MLEIRVYVHELRFQIWQRYLRVSSEESHYAESIGSSLSRNQPCRWHVTNYNLILRCQQQDKDWKQDCWIMVWLTFEASGSCPEDGRKLGLYPPDVRVCSTTNDYEKSLQKLWNILRGRGIGITFESGDAVFAGVSCEAFLFDFLHQDKEMRRMPFRRCSFTSFLLFILTCYVVF